MTKIIIICVILYLYFYTPSYLMNLLYGLYSGNVTLKYLSNDNKLYLGEFYHRYYDGPLIGETIKQDYKKALTEILNDNTINDFKPYQIFKAERFEANNITYSSFTTFVGKFVEEKLNYVDKVKIGIVVNVRHQLKNKNTFGNYLKFAFYTAYKGDDLNTICSKQKEAIEIVRNTNYIIKTSTLYELTQLLTADYTFNSWKDLTYFDLGDVTLTRQNSNNLEEVEIEKLYTENNKSFIVLDYMNNNYILSSITVL